ncbi:hypothetical protein LCGC14_2037590 [marine sediment metagenome]|uniref:Uncharacterized protein n=1 Tax=marine sediment metagenome TaxID=412755 RepID=A0A0F9ESQ2_9ZZZZ
MIEQKLMQYLPDPNTVKENIGAAVDVLMEQSPLVVQEILRWHFAISFICFLFGIVLFVASIVTTIKVFKFLSIWLKKKVETDRYADEDIRFFALAFLFIVIPSCAIMYSNLAWLKILIAPRLFLIEYVANLF